MRDIEQLQRERTEPATEAVVSESFMHSLYSFGIWPHSSSRDARNHVAVCVCEACAAYKYYGTMSKYIQHFKIMKNVQPSLSSLRRPLSPSLTSLRVVVTPKEGRI